MNVNSVPAQIHGGWPVTRHVPLAKVVRDVTFDFSWVARGDVSQTYRLGEGTHIP